MSAVHTDIPFDIDAVLTRYDPQSRLSEYFDRLLAENERINLVSRETTPDDLRRLAAESLLPLQVLKGTPSSYLDIGSGGGLPAVPLILALPSLKRVALLERRGRKAAALDRLLTALQFTAEVLPEDYLTAKLTETFDLITLRLVKPQAAMLSRIGHNLTDHGSFVYYSAEPPHKNLFHTQPYTFTCPQSSAVKHFTLLRKK